MKSVFRAVLALTLLFSTVLVGASPAMAQTTGPSAEPCTWSGEREPGQYHCRADQHVRNSDRQRRRDERHWRLHASST